MSAESEAVKTALDKLAGTATYGGAVGPSGLTSLLGTNPAQLAAQEAAKAGAAKFGLGTLMQGLGPLALAYSVADLLGFFDGSGMVAEETTPEQDAYQKIATKVAQGAVLGEGGTEGYQETLEDAVNQGLMLGLSPTEVKDAVVEGTADVANIVFPGPQLEAFIPNIMDIVRGGAGGTFVLGGGQAPATILGTGQTGAGRGTKVGIPQIPILGPIIDRAIDIHQQGGNVADIIASIPSTVIDQAPTILAGVASAGLLFDEDDKETLVGYGVEPSIIREKETIGGADTVTPTPDAGTAPDIVTAAETSTTTKTDPLLPSAEVPVTRTSLPGAEVPVTRTSLPTAELPAVTRTSLPEAVVADIIASERTDPTRTSLPEPTKTSVEAAAAGGGGGGGGGGTTAPSGGIRTVSGGPGPSVDIDYLYDFAKGLEQPFQATEEEEEDIVRAAEGGMIGGTDDFERILRILRGM